jgi:mutator protein MutT
MSFVDVVAAVLCRGGHYLVGLRPAHKAHGGMWEFPGGKMDPNETPEAAAARELREELELELVGTGAVLGAVDHPSVGVCVHFLEVEAYGDPVLHEHEELRWCSYEQLLRLPLAPSDRRFVREILNGNV